MTAWQHSPTVEMVTRRCYDCGRFYAHERALVMENPECPVCAGRKRTALLSKLTSAERSNAALRGALKRSKKGDA